MQYHGSSVQVPRGPRKPQPGGTPLFPSDLAIRALSAPPESPGHAWTQPGTSMPPAQLHYAKNLGGSPKFTWARKLYSWEFVNEMVIILQNPTSHFHLFLHKDFYLLSVKSSCQQNLPKGLTPPPPLLPPDWILQAGDFRPCIYPYFWQSLWLSLCGMVFALSSLVPDPLLFRSHKTLWATGLTTWSCIHTGFPGIRYQYHQEHFL